MHRTWQIPEVVELICGAADFPTLASLARTCQTVQPPALAVLWANQKDFTRLLKCLPSDLWEEVAGTAPTITVKKIKLRRNITPSDWERVLVYAVYVKSLVQEGPMVLSWEIYQAISISLPTLPLFPNIRHLTWKTRNDYIFPYFRMLVGRKLQSISLDMDGSETARAALLPFLTTFYPKLTRLEYDSPLTEQPRVSEAICTAIRSLNHLETLTYAGLDLPTLLHLARLPNLSRLDVGRLVFPLDSPMMGEFQAKVASTGPVFVALRDFTTFSEPPGHVIKFLDAIDPDALEKVDLEIESPTSTEIWQTVTTSLARKSFKTLRVLSLKESFSYEHEIPDKLELMLSTESIQPLLTCANLAEVTLLAGHGINVDDAFLKQMARAWPRLEKLDLAPGCQSARYVPQITLCGLIPLAEHCPRLASLALVLDTTLADPYSSQKPGGGISNSALRELEVVESPLSLPIPVGLFLSAIFPHLESVTSREEQFRNMLMPDWEENMFNWASVGNLVRAFSCARTQERVG
ncbi:hypothetical protein C8R47DRAFT_94068 [Mycena vitilis]|nr:hypothetical protein C8R47DRAFT_94068 [Mycena vitilis]